MPTGDVQVKAKLREFGEPASAPTKGRLSEAKADRGRVSEAFREFFAEVCIFGEGPYERRDRLRTIMAGRRYLRALRLSRDTLTENREIEI